MVRDRTIAAYTLGCKVNQYDTEAMLERFEAAGYRAVGFQETADVYLVNTCTVTGTGDQKSLKTIRRVAREHPGCAIVVCGCLAQREAERLATMDNVALVLGVQRRGEVVGLLESALASGQAVNAAAPLKGAGMSFCSSLSRIAENMRMTRVKPRPPPRPYMTLSAKLCWSDVLRSVSPSTMQFVVMRGR